MNTELVVYSTTWCGYCVRLKRFLDAEGIGYREVDLETDPDGERFVRNVAAGNATVPTVRFPDGSAAVNPSPAEIRSRLQDIAQTRA